MNKEELIELKKECNMCTKKWTRSRRKKFTELLQRKIKENNKLVKGKIKIGE